MKHVGIINTKVCNIGSIQNAISSLGYQTDIIVTCTDNSKYSHLILPGVGCFKECIKHLIDSRLIDLILEHIHLKKPFLGICLGLQLLAEFGDEFGGMNGLNIIKGKVQKLPTQKVKQLPHVGWNNVKFKNSPLFDGIAQENNLFYFSHSFYLTPSENSMVVGKTKINEFEFTSAIRRDNVHAVQFHPEKSGKFGKILLNNFCTLN